MSLCEFVRVLTREFIVQVNPVRLVIRREDETVRITGPRGRNLNSRRTGLFPMTG